MKKTDITAMLTTFSFTPDVSEMISQELSSYPEELSPEHVQRFDEFLASLQMSQVEEAHMIEELADALEESTVKVDEAVEDFVHDSLKAMKTGLSQAQDIAAMADSQ